MLRPSVFAHLNMRTPPCPAPSCDFRFHVEKHCSTVKFGFDSFSIHNPRASIFPLDFDIY